MKTIDPKKLSQKRLKIYYHYYEKLVKTYQASFAEYELFVSFQRELVLRKSQSRFIVGQFF